MMLTVYVKKNTGIKLDLFPRTAQVIILCTCPYIDLKTSKNLNPPPEKSWIDFNSC